MRFSEDFVIDTDQEPWCREGLRVTMLGGPGSGKSWNNSLLAEQFLTQGGTVVIFQPRNEYFTLKEKFDVLGIGGVHAKDMEFALTSPSIYARAVVEDGMSMIFYTSAAEDEEKLIKWVSRFIRYVLNYQERHKRPLLVILEEAQEYAPRTPSGHVAPPWVYNRMIKAFKDCFTQGRKLNIIAIASSQRPQELNFTIRQLANLTFFGKFSDQDIGYVDKECIRYVRKQGIEIDASRLVSLGLGEWLIIMSKQTRFTTVREQRLMKHGAETPRLEYVAPRTKQAKKTIDQLTKTIMEALKKEEAEKFELEKAKRKIRDLTKKLEAAEKKAEIKLSVKEMLEAGASEPELAEKLAKAETEIKDLRKKLAEQKSPEEIEKLRKTITQLNDQLAKLRTSHESLREWKGKLIRQVGALESENASLKEALESSEKIREVFSELIQGELKRLEWEPYKKGTAGLEPVAPSEVTVQMEQPTLAVEIFRKPLTLRQSDVEGKIAIVYAEGDLPKAKWFKATTVTKAFIKHGWKKDPRTSKILDQFCQWGYLEKHYAGKRPEYRLCITPEEAREKGLLKTTEKVEA